MSRITVFFTGVAFLATVSFAQPSSITPSSPTHYFYTPAAYVNPPYHLVLSFHEISFSLPANLQLQASIMDNIGRVNFGAKYGLLDNLSIGAGMAYNLVHLGRGSHGIHDRPRLGLYLTYGFIGTSSFEMAVTPHSQIGTHFSIGADLGTMITPHEIWSIIAEVGTSVDVNDGLFYLNLDGGVRIHPPKIPFLSFDFGIDLEEFAVNSERVSPTVGVFIDVIFAMVVK